MTERKTASAADISGLALYTQKILLEYLAIRENLEQITPELLHLFSDGKIEILERVAMGLKKISPQHPDLPLIYFVTNQIRRSSLSDTVKPGPGKGNKPIHSIPIEDVARSFLDVIHHGNYGTRRREDLTYALREILGAARRAGLPEILDRESLSAYRAELYVRDLAATTVKGKISACKTIGQLFGLDDETMNLIHNEKLAARLDAEGEMSQRHAAFQALPVSPLDFARLARSTSEEAYASTGNRQTTQRLFITAAALALLSFIPERVSDILDLSVGQEVSRDAQGWCSAYFSNKTKEDRSVDYLPDQLTPYLDDLILLGADTGPLGRDLIHLYRHRATIHSPLFARTDLCRPYSRGRVFELVKERTGHGPHAARIAMTDYLAEIGGSPTDILDLLGHRRIATSEKHYAVRANAIRRKRTLGEINNLREDLAKAGKFRLPTGKLIDLEQIARDLDRSV